MKKIEKEKTRYYYIPVATKFVEYDGEQLINILANLDDEIVRREEEYLSFLEIHSGKHQCLKTTWKNINKKHKRNISKEIL